ncbi:MAG: LysM peptidoglycan-binding domain-containing protein [Candidatus Promineifilaceae bacterium]
MGNKVMRRIGLLLFLVVTITTVIFLQNIVSDASANSGDCVNQTYVVQAGDNLGRIAWKHGVTLQQLLDANDLASHTDYHVGQTLVIPVGNCQSSTAPVSAAPSCDGQRYTVQAGDNLGRIAWQFNISLGALIEANNLAGYNDYYVGQELVIPVANCGTNETAPKPFSITYRERFGVAGAASHAAAARKAGLDFGSFISWNINDVTHVLPNVQTELHVIRLTQAGTVDTQAQILAAVQANKGETWIVGNEMDVIWQDNVTPERYATLYHNLYQAIKKQDPTANVAIGAIATPTPLRQAYLDLVLAAYQTQYGVSMPIDVWTIHTYILREERNSWGAEIPPGMPSINEGMLYEIDDHGDVQEMTRLIGDFRQWMANKGYQDVPLLITEMGILMPADFGFPPEVVSQYMHTLLSYLLNTKSAQTGYPQDGNRLVQQWFWFSISDEQFAVSNLYDLESGTVTAIGKVYTGYLR